MASSATVDLELVSIADATRQYTQLGLGASTGTALVFVTLRGPSGSALVGIPASDIQLLDGNDQPVGGVRGPFFFGVSGDLTSTADLATSIAVAGRARAGFLDCPPGTYRLEVTVDSDAAATVFNVPVTCDAGGATLVATGN